MSDVGLLAVSAACILMTCTLAYFARIIIKKTVTNDFVKILFEEAIAAAELCGCCFELIIGNYYFLSLFVCVYLYFFILKRSLQ